MCTYYEGYAEVSLTWVSAALNLTASAASIVHGNSVTFTATADPATVGGRVVPLNIQSWEWESNYGGSTNPGCGTATQCVYSPVTSGTMRVSGLVNQDLQEAIVSVIVTDSTECGGSQIRSMTQMNLSSGCEGGGGDTTGGGGGNGGLPTLLLSCVDSATLSSTITRGQTAVCRMSMSDSSSPPVSVLRAEGAPNAVYYLSGPYGGVASVTLPYAWVGRVAASGVVSAEVDVGGHPVRQTATLNVVPRTWTPTIQPPVTTYGGLGRADLRLWGYPARAIGASRVGPNENNVKAMIVGGPNDGVWWAANQPLIYDSIWIHPGLDSARAAAVGGGPLQWYNDQNGIPAGTCNSTYMPALLADVLRHEGVTLSSDSHRGHWVAALPGSGLTGDWEKSYHRASADLSSLMFGSIWGRVNSLQLQHERAYDSTQNSTSTISARVTGNACIFDYDSTAN